jgi:gamma-glutamyltranspeptidase / glutathione hydrolase
MHDTTDSPSVDTRRGVFGMASSCHWQGADIACEVLEAGGNAFDAAVAAGFVLQVVEPHFNGPAGEVVGLLAPIGSPPVVLAGAGPAPASANIDVFHHYGLNLVPGAGVLSASVPGQFDAWCLLLRNYGTWTLDAILERAIDLAAHGFPVTGSLHKALTASKDRFIKHWPTSAHQWIPDGLVPPEGSTIRNESFALTLRELSDVAAAHADRVAGIDAARNAWATGFVAQHITEFLDTPRWHPDGVMAKGLLSARDMAEFSATFESPVSIEFMGLTFIKAAAWTQGPAFLQTLGILEVATNLSTGSFDPDDAETIHRITEATNLAMADREAYFGDWEVPLGVLLDSDYLTSRGALIGAIARAEYPPGQIKDAAPHIPHSECVSDPLPQEPWAAERLGRSDTCQICVVDQWGNMVSATPSGGWLQSSPYIPDLGFSLGTRLQQLWLDPQSPSSLRPGIRPRLTLTPTLVYRGNEAILAMGSPGGDGQNQWQIQMLLRILTGDGELHLDRMQEAINAPAYQSLGFASSFWPRETHPHGLLIEDRFTEEIREELARRGHQVTVVDGWSLGRVSAVARDPKTQEMFGAVSPRGHQGGVCGR